MSGAKHTDMVLAADVSELDDEQRGKLLAWFEAHPDGGLKSALTSIGIRATKAEARRLLLSDAELRDARFRSVGLDQASLFKRLGQIASDHDHKDTFRATMASLNMFHGWRESTEAVIDVSHSGSVVVEHERRLTLNDVVGLARELAGSGDSVGGVVPATRALLPAPEDG